MLEDLFETKKKEEIFRYDLIFVFERIKINVKFCFEFLYLNCTLQLRTKFIFRLNGQNDLFFR